MPGWSDWALLAVFGANLSVTWAFSQPSNRLGSAKHSSTDNHIASHRPVIPAYVPQATATKSSTALCMERLTLYGHPGTRSPLINWACYELGVDFTMSSDLSTNPHPFGQLPCMVVTDDSDNDDETTVLFESGAILQYLNRYYAPDHLTKSQLGSIMSWITWANASLDPICFLETPEGKVYDTGLRQPNRKIATLDAILSEQQFLLPSTADNDGFSTADVAVASYLLYVVQFFPSLTDLATRWPNVVRYMKDCASRPAYAQAFGAALQGKLVAILSEMLPQDGGDTPKDSKKKLFGVF